MKITFPHFGNSCYAAKVTFDALGIDYVMPKLSNKKALEIGSLYSPEEICLPFKIMIGNYIGAIKKGADTIVIPGSCGPCRFGEYCELQMKILKRLGYNLNFIVIDYPKSIGTKEFLNRISIISNESTKTSKEKFKSLIYGLKVINFIDDIEKVARFKAGYEINKGECKDILYSCKTEAFKCNSPSEMLNLLRNYKNKLNNVPIDKNKNPIKIAIIGEIYTIMEPFSNLYIEDKLMNLGVSTKKGLYPSWWVKNAALSPLKLNSLNIRKASRKYLPLYIGGHGRECIGEAMLAKKEGFDGIIQIFPLGCMPEIVSKSILPTISNNEDIPIMSLVVDEMTGEAGYITRIEAFIDLLERRRDNVLYGS
ncbi:2-hydroxyglutaryl-CoA dehydratase [Clostridium niameyense]|uniref:2-hydroxyglutaryl-CoA dehydratase n=1 Tax=Clostridium niameyense TaxID=1622073 RepID=UPI00067ECDAC|nr:2-hydroxyglutaryl-CoA dehydratase [Clostridium niameyense]